MSYGQAPFMRFYESKNGQDTRFEITGAVSGCMLYYDDSIGKFVNSNYLLFDPNTFTFSVHQVDTDYLNATTEITTESMVVNDTLKLVETVSGLTYYELFNTANVFTFAYNSFSIATITSVGVTTLIPTKIQNILQTTGTQFLTIVPLSATTSTGQVVGTHAALNYVVSTGTLSSTVFSGSLTGSATLIDTTLQTTGTRFLTHVPLSATTSAGQVVGTHAALFYVVGESQLNIGNTAGLTGADSVPLSMLNNALVDGAYNNIQLGHSNDIDKSWFIGARNNTSAANSILSIAPYGTGQADCFYVTTTGVASATVIEGRSYIISPNIYATDGVSATVSFTGPGTNLTGTGASFTAGSANLCKVVSSSAATAFPLVFATAATSASLLNETSLTYQPSNNALILTGGTFSCPTITATSSFIGDLTGSATLIDTTLVTSGTFYLTMVPLNSTQSGGQVLGTDPGISFAPSTNTFTTGTIAAAGTSLTGTGASFTSGTGNAIKTINPSVNGTYYPLYSTNTTAQTSTSVYTTPIAYISVNTTTSVVDVPILTTDTATIIDLNNTTGSFTAVTSITISSAFSASFDYYDIIFIIKSVSILGIGAVVRFDVGPTASALWANTYIIQYNTTTPVTSIVNNTAQSVVDLGSSIDGFQMYKLTYSQATSPFVMWDGIIYNGGGNGLSRGQARYNGVPSPLFTQAIFSIVTGTFTGSYSIRGYN